MVRHWCMEHCCRLSSECKLIIKPTFEAIIFHAWLQERNNHPFKLPVMTNIYAAQLLMQLDCCHAMLLLLMLQGQ